MLSRAGGGLKGLVPKLELLGTGVVSALAWRTVACHSSSILGYLKCSKTPVFHSASMGFHRIANWRVGDASTHKPASFLYMYNKYSNT